MVKILEEKLMVLYPSENVQRKVAKVKCSRCDKEFWRDIRSVRKSKNDIYCSDECKYEKVEVECAYCGIQFNKSPSRLSRSRSGLYFCCREHKDLAQRIENNIPEIWASHYGTSLLEYRDKSIRHYGNTCEHCGYDDLDILHVHHIDKNRENNELENLIVLCPNCHASVHKNFMIIENRKLIKNNS